MTNRIWIDAEVLELRLPEDRRIRVKNVEDLASIASKLSKPILHEVVNQRPCIMDSKSSTDGSHVLAVYDGSWVYFCELGEGQSLKDESDTL